MRCQKRLKTHLINFGIPEAEKRSLAGVGAQYDSEVVYHSMKEELLEQGVIYTDMAKIRLVLGLYRVSCFKGLSK